MAIIETIKFEGPSEALVWRSTGKEYMLMNDEGIDAGSQLIVDAFHEAILFANGYALDRYKEGNHTLTTQNIPLLKAQYEKLATKTPFPCRVYFINIVHQLDLKWGTQGGISLEDPVYNTFFHVGCCGTMAVKISDSRKFLLKFVGDKDVFTSNDLIYQLKGIISAKVKYYISQIMINGKVSFFVMNAKLLEIGEIVASQLKPIFEDYGIEIQHFNIESIDVPKEDYSLLQEAKLRSAGRNAEGSTWDKEQMYKVLQTAAENEGIAGQIVGTGVGIGMGVGVGTGIGHAMNSITDTVFGSNNMSMVSETIVEPKSVNTQESGTNLNVNTFFNGEPKENIPTMFCPSCGKESPQNARFCSQCGHKFSTKSFCHSCGSEVTPDSTFCSSCGTKLK